jgi:hypothetical protein
MRLMPFVLGLAILAGCTSAFAAARSDFTKSFPLQTLKTFEFKNQQRISRDPLRAFITTHGRPRSLAEHQRPQGSGPRPQRRQLLNPLIPLRPEA